MQTVWELSVGVEGTTATLDRVGAAPFEALSLLLRKSTSAVVDLGDHALPAGAAPALAQAHRALRERGVRLAYAASVPATRALCVVGLHQAQDPDSQVLADVALARRALRGGSRLGDALESLGAANLQPTPGRTPGALQRALAWGMSWGSRRRVGYDAPFMEQMLATYGLGGLGGGLARSLQSPVDQLEQALGVWQTQVLIALTAMGTGCGFCGPGHLYAGNLLYFQATGGLLPLDERNARVWMRQPDAQLRPQILSILEPFSELHQRAARVFELRAGAPPRDAVDRALRGVHHAWALISEASLQVEPGPIQAIHPQVGRALELQRRYRQARAEAEGAAA